MLGYYILVWLVYVLVRLIYKLIRLVYLLISWTKIKLARTLIAHFCHFIFAGRPARQLKHFRMLDTEKPLYITKKISYEVEFNLKYFTNIYISRANIYILIRLIYISPANINYL
jgi:hypothetical protein